MERESTGKKYIAANFEESQNPPRAVELRKKKIKKYKIERFCKDTFLKFVVLYIHTQR
jgi:hypothetical protein